jgi:hypothetical protein
MSIHYDSVSELTALRMARKINDNPETKETEMTEQEAQLIAKLVAEQIMNDNTFVSNMLYDLNSRINYQHLTNEVAERITTSELAERIMDVDDMACRRFSNRLMDTDKFRQRMRIEMHTVIGEHMNGDRIKNDIEYLVDTKSTNMANEIVARTLKLISKRITEASDV